MPRKPGFRCVSLVAHVEKALDAPGVSDTKLREHLNTLDKIARDPNMDERARVRALEALIGYNQKRSELALKAYAIEKRSEREQSGDGQAGGLTFIIEEEPHGSDAPHPRPSKADGDSAGKGA